MLAKKKQSVAAGDARLGRYCCRGGNSSINDANATNKASKKIIVHDDDGDDFGIGSCSIGNDDGNNMVEMKSVLILLQVCKQTHEEEGTTSTNNNNINNNNGDASYFPVFF